MVQFQGKKGKKGATKPKKQVKPTPPPKEESSEEEEESESEEEETPKVKAKKPVKAPAKTEEESEEEDSDEDVKTPANGKSKKAEEDDDDDEEDDDEEDEDEESDEEEEVAPKKAKVKPAGQSMEVDDDDEDDDDDDDEEEEEKPQKVTEKKGKRKQQDAETVPSKKQKTESEGDLVTMLFSNLPEGTTDKSFNKFLNSKGIQCKSCRANYGKCKAFVDVATSDKGKALGLDQVEWNDTEISVSAAEPRNQGTEGRDNSDRDSRTLFVRNLPFHASEDDLMGVFQDVEEVRLLMDRNTGRPKGIAFVQFNDASSLEKVMENKDDFELEGRQLYLDYTGDRASKPPAGRPSFGSGGSRGGRFGGGDSGRSAPSKTLFVKGVTEDMTKEEFAKYFEDASDVRMITDRDTGKNKFFAYVEFDSEDLATKCYTSSKGGIEAEDGSTTFQVDFARDRRSDGGGGGRGGGGFRGRGGGRGGGGFRGRGGRGGGFRGRGGRGGGFRGRGGRGGGGFEGRRTTFNQDSD